MPEENKEGGNPSPEITAETLAKMQGQIDNLNKGIATYRDEAQRYKSDSERIKSEFDELKNKIEFVADDEEIELSSEDQKKLESWARKQGFVTAEQMEAEKSNIYNASLKTIENQAVTSFLDKHPEYDTDEDWSKIRTEFEQYKTPTTLDGYNKLLNKIHNELTGGTSKAKEDGKAQARAELITKSRLSLGGGNQGSGSDNSQDIDALQKRYPNLSREQISERLAELASLGKK